jgi:hypothetical protein
LTADISDSVLELAAGPLKFDSNKFQMPGLLLRVGLVDWFVGLVGDYLNLYVKQKDDDHKSLGYLVVEFLNLGLCIATYFHSTLQRPLLLLQYLFSQRQAYIYSDKMTGSMVIREDEF